MTHNDLRYGFAPYQLDPAKRILTRDGEATSLAPKATEIRLVLVKHAGRLVPKDELRTEVWPAQYSDKALLPSKRHSTTLKPSDITGLFRQSTTRWALSE